MNINKPFYKQTPFYLSIFALGLVITALALYVLNCPSEFNGEVVSSAVVTADVVAIIFITIAIAANIAENYLTDKPMIMDILSYRRFTIYVALAALLYSLFMSVLAEYSLIGTILYPIVSGTVGDPVDPVLSFSYFTALIGTLVAAILSSTAAVKLRTAFYKTQIAENQPLMENKAKGD